MKNNAAGKKTLDSTLRYPYITLSHKGGSLLAIRFTHRGKKWEVDTVDEAIRLRRELDLLDDEEMNIDPTVEERLIRADSPWTPDVFLDFVQQIGTLQQKAIRVMLAKNGIRSDELAKR